MLPRLPPTRTMSRPWRPPLHLLLAGALVAATLLVYAQILGHGFIHYDDDSYVVLNEHVQQGWSREGLRWAFTTRYHYHWHPLTWLSHMTDVQLFGMNAAAHHAVSLALHLVNILLLFLFLLRARGEPWHSAVVAGLFALHPFHVENVAWVADRKDLLMALFGLLALLLYQEYCQRPRWWRLLAVMAAILLGMLAKPALVVLPLLLLVLDIWPLARLPGTRPAAGYTPAGVVEAVPAVSWRRALLEKALMLSPVLPPLLVVLWANLSGGLAGLERFATSPALLGKGFDNLMFYLGRTLLPVDLALPYPPTPTPALWQGLLAAGLVLVLSAGAWWQRRVQPWLLAGWLWFLITIAPAAGFMLVGTQLRADRYTYLPLIGLFIAVVWGVPQLLPATRWGRRALVALALAALTACGALAHRQAALWQDEFALIEHALEVTRENLDAHVNMGVALAGRGRFDEALEHFGRARAIYPRDLEATYGQAVARLRLGRAHQALPELRQLVERRPRRGDFRAAYADTLLALGREDEALAEYRSAVEHDPDNLAARNNYGMLLAKQGKLAEAARQFEWALQRWPDRPDLHGNLANVRLLQEDYPAAARHYQAVLDVDPAHTESAYRLAAISARQGELDRAIELFQRALSSAPERPDLMVGLASALARRGQHRQARQLLTQALSLQPEYTPAREALNRLDSAADRSGEATQEPRRER